MSCHKLLPFQTVPLKYFLLLIFGIADPLSSGEVSQALDKFNELDSKSFEASQSYDECIKNIKEYAIQIKLPYPSIKAEPESPWTSSTVTSVCYTARGNLIKVKQEFDWYGKLEHTEVTVELVRQKSRYPNFHIYPPHVDWYIYKYTHR